MDKKEFAGIIDMAIAAEIEAYEFYKEVEATVSDPSLKTLFKEFAGEEEVHRTALEGIKEKEIQNFSFLEGADYKVSEVVELPKLSITMKPSDANRACYEERGRAMKIYRNFATATTTLKKQKILASLANMEEAHKTKMEGLYVQTASPRSLVNILGQGDRAIVSIRNVKQGTIALSNDKVVKVRLSITDSEQLERSA